MSRDVSFSWAGTPIGRVRVADLARWRLLGLLGCPPKQIDKLLEDADVPPADRAPGHHN